MPCDTCGARQTDPVRGASPWKRGVRRGLQVLVCPDCQVAGDWTADLDRCPTCGSTALVRRLGETHCRTCGVVVPNQPSAPRGRDSADAPADGAAARGAQPASTAPGLAEEVAAALARLRLRG